ncbi:unnamed protein product (macronuclear) [Paramecium tetraurelia]|uniref:MORN repeat protein n=1 Tax=Paramecium tetraurelia TaxID=5888 RepID=A0EBQ9_PARTE|nr:uncharacterized protein GSPATT00025460001 [Paramecium tetraurelia]CAK92726.1 unnamed protein product [Paramecium tetraurelia]|eukprot:XP_001460123.1 hypothetical protein (macronuclear) [Paramecium tetraurelia strain d4-2]
MKRYFKDTQKTTAESNPPMSQRLKRVNSLGILESPFRTNNQKIMLTQSSINKLKNDKFQKFTSQLISIRSQLQKNNLENLDQQSYLQSCYMSNLSSQQSIKSCLNSINNNNPTNMDTNRRSSISINRNRIHNSTHSVNKFKKSNFRFIEHIQNGRGRKMYENGFTYEGEWEDGLRSGNGTLKDTNQKIIYQGEWLQDHFEGKGRFINQDFQEDQFNLNNFKSFQLVQHQFTIYEGEFRNGQFFGKGVMQFNCGGELYKFVGRFSQDTFHGVGTLLLDDEIILQGKWIYGCIV